jgi:transposase
MYLRTIQRHNKDGSTVRYVQLAHNHRKGGSTQAEVLVHLGREDRLDMEGLRRLVSSITRYLDGAGVLPPTAGAGHDPALAVESSRTLGAVWLLDGLWQRLGVADALGGVLGARRFTTDVERVLFALVANRAVDPMSKLSAAEWACQDAAIPRLAGMDDDQAYRAMDLLVTADAQARVQEAVFFAAAHLLNLEVDLLFFDTTSTFFHRDTEEAGPGAFRLYGHSKDHRGDLPQIVIGLAVTREGIPVRVWCWPGSTNDQTVIRQVKDDLRGWRLGRVVTVVDRGFASDDNLAYLTRAGGHWIAGERLRDGRADVAAVLARQGRYQQVRDNLRVKEVRLGSGDAARRFVLCHNPEQAERDRTQREQAVARLEAELERIAALRAKAAKRAKAKTAPTGRGRRRGAQEQAHADDHLKAECALRDHPTLGRWLRQTPGGRLVIDRAKLKAEAKLDGKFLLSTSDPDLSAEDIALGYKNLLEAERAFRDLKTTLELRPVWHRLEQRIRAHVLLCWLALLLVRVAERQTGQTWRRVNLELGRLHLVTLTGAAGRVEQTTALTSTQRELFTATSIAPPPRVTSLHPA